MENTPLTCQRDKFIIPEGVCYMNSSYISPLLKSVEEAGINGIKIRRQPWNITPPDFFEPAEQVRALFAQLVNADPEGVALIPSVSYGVGIAAANLPLSAGQSVVILKEQFPSNVYAWEVLSQDKQALLKRVPYPENDDLTSALLETIDQTTAIVALPEIHWHTGAKIDLVKIRARTRSVGATLVVDASQSLGAAGFDVGQIQPDVLINTGYKGVLGPYGLCFAYFSPEWRTGRPLEQGWLNRVKSDDFAGLTNYQSQYRDGARRYDMGERANPIHLTMAAAALNQLLEWGMDRVTAYNRSLVKLIIDKADDCGFDHTDAAYCSDNMLGVTLPPRMSSEWETALQKEKVYIAKRGNRIRLAPHVYNDTAEVDRLFEVLPRYLK